MQDLIEKYPEEPCDFLIETDAISGMAREIVQRAVNVSKGNERGTMGDDVAEKKQNEPMDSKRMFEVDDFGGRYQLLDIILLSQPLILILMSQGTVEADQRQLIP